MLARLFPFVLLFFFFTNVVFGQNPSLSKTALSQQFRFKKYENEAVNASNFFEFHGEAMGLSEDDTFLEYKVNTTPGKATHRKFRQYYKEVPVFGMNYLLHEKDDYVYASNGSYLPMLDLDVNPTLTKEEAVQAAVGYSDHGTLAWEQDPDKYPDPSLMIIDNNYPKISSKQVLVYSVEIQSFKPYDKQQYFIDAKTGHLVFQLSMLQGVSVTGTGVSRYYGVQEIVVDSLSPDKFVLTDDTRGDGITTFNSDFSLFEDEDNYWDYSNEKNGEVAFDAHFCTEKFYDIMLEKFGWAGVNGEGSSMNSVVYVDDPAGNFLNAFWDGNYAYFGNGDCNYGPLTTLDVVGHEFMHGITQATSNLIYAGESGAINESMSDIFGKVLEWNERPDNFTWIIGGDFLLTELAVPLRQMDEPTVQGNPDFYKGDLWVDGAGVHTNSSVGNHWFYLMVEGESGVNQNGENYEINALGMDAASQIVFKCERDYLAENSNYPEYYEVSLLAAEEIYGASSDEYLNMLEAWKAVGLPYGGGAEDFADLGISQSTNFDYVCIFDDYYPFEVIVTNEGSVPYTAEDPRIITVNNDFESFTIEVDVPLLPGETVSYPLDEFVFLIGGENLFIDINLSGNDDNFFNDYNYIGIFNAATQEADLFINAYADQLGCFPEEVSLNVIFYNQGCDVIAAGTMVDVVVEDANGSKIHERTIELASDINFSSSFSTSFNFDYPGGGTNSYTCKVNYEEADESNNFSTFGIFESDALIEDDYLNSFTDFSDLNDQIVFENFGSQSLYDYQGESWLSITNYTLFPFGAPCANIEDVFSGEINFSGVMATLKTCVDLRDKGSYRLSFDMIQFVNDDSEIMLEGTALKLSFKGSTDWEEYIFGQEEGALISYSYDIPADFQGELILEFYTRTGNDFLDNSALEYDVILLDNLVLESVVSTESLVAETVDLEVFPNPVNNKLQLRSTADLVSAKVYNNQGQMVIAGLPIGDMNTIDIQDLYPGHYVINAITEQGENLAASFIKIE